jgi:hypothetical protein
MSVGLFTGVLHEGLRRCGQPGVQGFGLQGGSPDAAGQDGPRLRGEGAGKGEVTMFFPSFSL